MIWFNCKVSSQLFSPVGTVECLAGCPRGLGLNTLSRATSGTCPRFATSPNPPAPAPQKRGLNRYSKFDTSLLNFGRPSTKCTNKIFVDQSYSIRYMLLSNSFMNHIHLGNRPFSSPTLSVSGGKVWTYVIRWSLLLMFVFLCWSYQITKKYDVD